MSLHSHNSFLTWKLQSKQVSEFNKYLWRSHYPLSPELGTKQDKPLTSQSLYFRAIAVKYIKQLICSEKQQKAGCSRSQVPGWEELLCIEGSRVAPLMEDWHGTVCEQGTWGRAWGRSMLEVPPSQQGGQTGRPGIKEGTLHSPTVSCWRGGVSVFPLHEDLKFSIYTTDTQHVPTSVSQLQPRPGSLTVVINI